PHHRPPRLRGEEKRGAAMKFFRSLEGAAARPVLRRGDRVLARWNDGRYWFPGRIEWSDDTVMAVHYDDGMDDVRPAGDVRPFDWRIGSRIDAIWSGNGEWYAATIADIGDDGRAVTVLFEDGIREATSSARCRSG